MQLKLVLSKLLSFLPPPMRNWWNPGFILPIAFPNFQPPKNCPLLSHQICAARSAVTRSYTLTLESALPHILDSVRRSFHPDAARTTPHRCRAPERVSTGISLITDELATELEVEVLWKPLGQAPSPKFQTAYHLGVTQLDPKTWF